MRGIKALVAGVVLGVLVGLWIGVNIGRDQPLLSSPFEERTVEQKLKRAGQEVGEAVEKGGRAIQDRLREESKTN